MWQATPASGSWVFRAVDARTSSFFTPSGSLNRHGGTRIGRVTGMSIGFTIQIGQVI
jgi:hypothetical protein